LTTSTFKVYLFIDFKPFYSIWIYYLFVF
jgi:hypothetical protein